MTLNVDDVLERNRNPVQGSSSATFGTFPVRPPRRVQRFIGENRKECVQALVVALIRSR
jgi:hypothetical protein